MLDFRVETVGSIGDCAVLRVTGEVDVYTAPALRERASELLAKGAVHQIVDLSGVAFLDSTGLGVLVGNLKRLRAHQGSLALVISAAHMLRIFQITGLNKVFPPHASVADAINADPHWREAIQADADDAEQWCQRHGLV